MRFRQIKAYQAYAISALGQVPFKKRNFVYKKYILPALDGKELPKSLKKLVGVSV